MIDVTIIVLGRPGAGKTQIMRKIVETLRGGNLEISEVEFDNTIEKISVKGTTS